MVVSRKSPSSYLQVKVTLQKFLLFMELLIFKFFRVPCVKKVVLSKQWTETKVDK